MREDLAAFRQREIDGCFPVREVLSIRTPEIMRRRLASKALEVGSSPSELARFLIAQGLKSYGVDALGVF